MAVLADRSKSLTPTQPHSIWSAFHAVGGKLRAKLLAKLSSPHPVGLVGMGIDAIDLERFRAVLARRHSMAERLFTPGERASVAARVDALPALAARFAAKEATMKALGVGLGAIGWHDVEVVRAESGQPSLVLSGRAAALSVAAGVSDWKVSLTHSDTQAVAVVAAVSQH